MKTSLTMTGLLLLKVLALVTLITLTITARASTELRGGHPKIINQVWSGDMTMRQAKKLQEKLDKCIDERLEIAKDYKVEATYSDASEKCITKLAI